MARLTTQQALEILKKPVYTTHINEAKLHEERLKLHVEPILEKSKLPLNAYRNYTSWVSQLLPKKKYERFCQLLTVPLDTVQSTKAVFDELTNIFDTQDGFEKYDFITPELTDDFLNYLKEINDSDFWPSQCWEAIKKAINSILIVDLPAEQTGELPEPYYFLLSISNVIDVNFNQRTFDIEYIAYNDKPNIAVVLDDEFYRVFQKDAGGDWSLLSENAHTIYAEDDDSDEIVSGLGYCPAAPLYKKTIQRENLANKRGPITDVLGKLDELLFWRTSQKYLNLYGAWPIIVSYESKCEYRDEKGNECVNGKINVDLISGVEGVPTVKDCPACSQKELIGPGSSWTVTPPRNKDDFDPMANPIKSFEISNDKLTFAVSEIIRKEDEIYLDCVGFDGDAMNNQAINKNQVAANFESKETILNGIKIEVQRVKKFAHDTMARLRYGDYFVKSIIDFGSEYFLKSVDNLTNHLKAAKDNGLPVYYVASIRDKIIQTGSKHNPDQQQREAVLAQLEPYPDLSFAQLQTLQVSVSDPIGYIIKINFTNFIQRFEREQTNIVQFASAIDFDTKINLINKKLNEYATEQQRKNTSAQTDSSGNAGASATPNNG